MIFFKDFPYRTKSEMLISTGHRYTYNIEQAAAYTFVLWLGLLLKYNILSNCVNIYMCKGIDCLDTTHYHYNVLFSRL